jgi:hypothetical protein
MGDAVRLGGGGARDGVWVVLQLLGLCLLMILGMQHASDRSCIYVCVPGGACRRGCPCRLGCTRCESMECGTDWEASRLCAGHGLPLHHLLPCRASMCLMLAGGHLPAQPADATFPYWGTLGMCHVYTSTFQRLDRCHMTLTLLMTLVLHPDQCISHAGSRWLYP